MSVQNASDSQKVDFLWKKIVYGAAKTDIAGNIDATQEPYASPLQIRGDRIMQQSNQIPAIIPGANSSVVSVYTTSLPIECTSASGIPTPRLTWITGVTNWIPPEFGSTYQVKVYISPSGQAGNVLTKGTQVFATGSGSNDLWVFDYQAGILNFNSNNTPYSGGGPISFTGNSVYISGAVYSGLFGLPDSANIANVILGNITFTGNTISSNQTNGNIILDPPGTGTVLFAGTSAVGLPSGDDSTRPLYPEIGYTRYNTNRQSIEYYDGNSWLAPGAATISSEVINPDGTANTYILGSNTSVDSVLVSINGTLQQPIYSYNIVNNNQITFTETPLTSDIIEVRFIAVSATSVSALRYGPASAVVLDVANVNVTGNLLPSANVAYDLGSSTLRWRTGYFSANTIDIGGGTIGLHDVLGFTFTTPSGTPQYMMPNGASTSNTFTSATVTIQGNLSIGGNVSIPVAKQLAIGNIILRDNGDGQLHARDITDNSDAVIVATISSPSVTQGNIQIGTNHIESINANGPISLRPNGSGEIVFAANLISAGKGGAELVIATGLALPAEYGVTYANSNILLSPGRVGLYNGNVRVTQTTAAVSSSTGAFQVIGGMGVGGSAFFGSNVTISGNITASYILGSAQFLTGLPVGYSNVNTKAYTESMGFANYSNVNVAAYTQTQSFTNYSNVNLSAYLGGAVTIGGNLTVNGNLFVNGNLTTINANNLNISDSLIFLADFNPADTLDIGIVSSFTSAVRYQHTGFVRDATDGTWKLFANVVPEPTTTVDFTNATYSNLQIGNLTAVNATLTGTINTTGNVLASRGNLGTLSVTGNITTTGSIIQNGITGGIIPIGGIIMWSGNVATIPTNWAFCNGLNGTPDLRNQFIIGAAADSSGQANTTVTGSTTKIGGTANAIVVSHTHTANVTDPGHFHNTRGTRQVQAGGDNSGPFVTESNWANDSNQYQTSPNSTGISVAISTNGSSATNANLPPYYALAFIMRIS